MNERLANVVEMVIQGDGFRSLNMTYIRPWSKAMPSWLMTAWLPGWKEPGLSLKLLLHVHGLEENLRLQDNAAQSMQTLRHAHGALSLETIEAKPVFDGDDITGLEPE